MVQEEDYLLDSTHKILLKKLRQVQTPPECRNAIICSTKYSNLFLSPDLENWQDMETDMDIANFIRACDDYIMWQTEKMLSIQDYAF